MALLVRVIGWLPSLAGLGVTVALIPVSALVGRRLGSVRRRLVVVTDARVKLCTEVITGETCGICSVGTPRPRRPCSTLQPTA
jgi:ATP-binding cassette subfamily C (CFTR/MRP) protein 1